MVFKAFESRIFSKLKESEKSEQLSDDVRYNSFGYDTYKLSKKIKRCFIGKYFRCLNDTDNTDNKLFTPVKKKQDLKYQLLSKCFKNDQ